MTAQNIPQLGTSEGTPEISTGKDLRELAEYGATLPTGVPEIEKLSLRQVKFLSDVKLGVDVVVGTFSASVEELIDLAPGSTFDFSFDPRDSVAVTLHGEKICDARFIVEDGALRLEVIGTVYEAQA